jgi:hypothetical protein
VQFFNISFYSGYYKYCHNNHRKEYAQEFVAL